MLELLAWGDTGWGDELVRGTLMTLAVALCSFALGQVFGGLGALVLFPLVITFMPAMSALKPQWAEANLTLGGTRSSFFSAAEAASAAAGSPCSSAATRWRSEKSTPVTSNPAAATERAIGKPMAPMPTKVTFCA